jgi:hypothetical protein
MQVRKLNNGANSRRFVPKKPPAPDKKTPAAQNDRAGGVPR